MVYWLYLQQKQSITCSLCIIFIKSSLLFSEEFFSFLSCDVSDAVWVLELCCFWFGRYPLGWTGFWALEDEASRHWLRHQELPAVKCCCESQHMGTDHKDVLHYHTWISSRELLVQRAQMSWPDAQRIRRTGARGKTNVWADSNLWEYMLYINNTFSDSIKKNHRINFFFFSSGTWKHLVEYVIQYTLGVLETAVRHPDKSKHLLHTTESPIKKKVHKNKLTNHNKNLHWMKLKSKQVFVLFLEINKIKYFKAWCEPN